MIGDSGGNSPTAKVPEMKLQTDELEKAISELESVSQKIFARLSGAGVLHDWPTEAGNLKAPESLVPAAQRLFEIRSIVGAVTGNLNRMVDNLEV